ncbi:hypothetical protein, partial [Lactobacillus crispatus]|uniref:hypothetical protein n=1 Tax=Lactobacillus crispatus TaxID=47770 RepID=UPI0010606B1D
RWLKGRFLLLKILKRTKKRSRFLKKEILIVFIHLEASFFPDTFLKLYSVNSKLIVVNIVWEECKTFAFAKFFFDFK